MAHRQVEEDSGDEEDARVAAAAAAAIGANIADEDEEDDEEEDQVIDEDDESAVNSSRHSTVENALIFQTDKSEPLRFFFDASVPAQVVEPLYDRILEHGGEVIVTDEDADIVLVPFDVSDDLLKTKQLSYKISVNRDRWRIRVERTSFVKACIHQAQLIPYRKPHATVRQGRVDFTADDDILLCDFLSRVTIDGKGRQGLKLYETLQEIADHDGNYAWARNHPAESWRGRYKNNKKQLDRTIEGMINSMSDDVRKHCLENQITYKTGPKPRKRKAETDSEEEGRELKGKRLSGNKSATSREPARVQKRVRASSPSLPPRVEVSRDKGKGKQRAAQREESDVEPESESGMNDDDPFSVPDLTLVETSHRANITTNTQMTLVDDEAESLAIRQASHSRAPAVGAGAGARQATTTQTRAGRPQPAQAAPETRANPQAKAVPQKKARRRNMQPESFPSPEETQEPTDLFSQEAARPDRQYPTGTQRSEIVKPQKAAHQRRQSERSVPVPAVASGAQAQPRQSMSGQQAGTNLAATPNNTGLAMSTPVRRGTVSSDSDNSSNFPARGTKADSMKKTLIYQNKVTPYTAYPGTRAAALNKSKF